MNESYMFPLGVVFVGFFRENKKRIIEMSTNTLRNLH